ncbi:FAR-17a/AIG1-like protein [Lentinula aciculospora]|uniref:FAR-17a/AIG1-like protein n=1 Tax=Lentinula aciculospora TaxID=153920 RepID=A0A9W9AT04_9AGAR|nr:FAR-17a/AIG1-like protein [Lentinula aciculospora]
MAFSLSRLLLHSAATTLMIYGYQSLTKLPIDAFISTQYGGHLQYLTIQGLFIACATSLLSLIIDLLPSLSVLNLLKRIMLIVSMPLSIVISSIYWPLLFLASQLILQDDETTGREPSSSSTSSQLLRIPLQLDLCLHAVPAITLLADFVLFERKYSRNELRYGATSVSVFYTMFYSWWVERCAGFNGGRFPYPFLTDNPIEVRLAIYAGAGTLALASFWLINRLHA